MAKKKKKKSKKSAAAPAQTTRKRKEKGKTQRPEFQTVVVIGPTGKRRTEKRPW